MEHEIVIKLKLIQEPGDVIRLIDEVSGLSISKVCTDNEVDEIFETIKQHESGLITGRELSNKLVTVLAPASITQTSVGTITDGKVSSSLDLRIDVMQANWDAMYDDVRRKVMRGDVATVKSLLAWNDASNIYVKVAEWSWLEGNVYENLDLAYRFTNSVEEAWFKSSHPQLKVLTAGARSSSIGDIFICRSAKGGEAARWMVASSGFVNIT